MEKEMKTLEQERQLTFKGKGIYYNDDYTLIKTCDCPSDEYLDIDTCWIGDLETFNEIINNL